MATPRCPETVGKSGTQLTCSTAYQEYGCRCDDCRAWKAEAKAEAYAKRKAEGCCQDCGAEELASETRCRECDFKHYMRDAKYKLRKRRERVQERLQERRIT